MLASHALKADLRIVFIAREIAVDPNPRHLAAFDHLILADDRDVVLALACHHAGVTTHTGAQVDHHAPLLALLVHIFWAVAFATKGLFVGRCREVRPTLLPFIPGAVLDDMLCVMGAVQIEVVDEILVAVEVVGVALANDRATIHDALLLRAGHFLRLGYFNQLGSSNKVRLG